MSQSEEQVAALPSGAHLTSARMAVLDPSRPLTLVPAEALLGSFAIAHPTAAWRGAAADSGAFGPQVRRGGSSSWPVTGEVVSRAWRIIGSTTWGESASCGR